MKTQLKKGLLDICVLAALIEEDSYGYKLIQDTKDLLDISESTLYPVLRRLEKAKYLRSYKKEYNGRLRKYYRITKDGIDYARSFSKEWEKLFKIYKYIEEKLDYEQRKILWKH